MDAATGEERWKHQTGGARDSAPAVADGLVYIGCEEGDLWALDAIIGREQWRLGTGGAIRSSPVVADGTVYFGSQDDHLYALRV